MISERLRKSILQAAIQGKLTEQLPEDGDARDLLAEIQAEKAQLMKDGKIKKEKDLPEITEDEIPFEIPKNWCWVRIPEVVFFQEGPGILAKDFRNSGVPLIRIAGMRGKMLTLEGCNYLDPEMVKKRWNHFRLELGDVCISTSASMDKVSVVDNETVNSIPYTGIIRFKPRGHFSIIYFTWFVQSQYYADEIAKLSAGGTIKHYGPSHLKQMLIPLPPIAEQQRIVENIKKVLPSLNKLEIDETKLDTLQKSFPKKMKDSLLQSAIQGKIAEQLEADGDAHDLVAEIQKKKARLIRENKIKKEKDLPEIMEDEIPFDIPENWCWVRLGDSILQNIGGGTPSKANPEYWGGDIPWASVKDLNCKYLTSTQDYITEEGLNHSSSNLIPKDNLIVCTRMGLGKIVFNSIDVAINQDLRALFLPENLNKWYLYYFYSTLSFTGKGATVKGISLEELSNTLVPLPPLAEQHRIVERLDQLLPLCDALE